MSSEVCQLCLEALTPLAEQCAKAQETDSPLFLATRHFLKVRAPTPRSSWSVRLRNLLDARTHSPGLTDEAVILHLCFVFWKMGVAAVMGALWPGHHSAAGAGAAPGPWVETCSLQRGDLCDAGAASLCLPGAGGQAAGPERSHSEALVLAAGL